MKKKAIVILSIFLLLTINSQAYPLYIFYDKPNPGPPYPPRLTKDDIKAATDFYKNLKWDLSLASTKRIIKIILPGMKNHSIYINKRSIESSGETVPYTWHQFYEGMGGKTIQTNIYLPEKTTEFEIHFGNLNNSRAVAVQYYRYKPGAKNMMVIDEKDIWYQLIDEKGNLEKYVDIEGNETTPPPGEGRTMPKQVYKDVYLDYPSFESIDALTRLHLMCGDKYGYFKPEKNISRAEFYSLFARILNQRWWLGQVYKNKIVPSVLPFNDASYKDVILVSKYMTPADFKKLYTKKQDMKEFITREEVAGIIAAACKRHSQFNWYKGNENDPPFDINSSPYRDGINFCVKTAHVMKCVDDKTFNPKGLVKKADLADLMTVLISRLGFSYKFNDYPPDILKRLGIGNDNNY